MYDEDKEKTTSVLWSEDGTVEMYARGHVYVGKFRSITDAMTHAEVRYWLLA